MAFAVISGECGDQAQLTTLQEGSEHIYYKVMLQQSLKQPVDSMSKEEKHC